MFTANIGKIFLDVHNGRRRGNSPSAARGKFWLNVSEKKNDSKSSHMLDYAFRQADESLLLNSFKTQMNIALKNLI